MGTLLRKAVAPLHGGSLHNKDRSILFNIAQVRKMKEQAVGRAYVLSITGLREWAVDGGGTVWDATRPVTQR